MKKILMHCAMEKEASKIAKKLKLNKLENIKCMYKCLECIYQGKTNEMQIDLVITGIGKQKTAMGLTEYFSKTENMPDLIINIGYAGSNNTKVGSWVCISKSYNLEWNIPGEEKYSMCDLGNQELVKVEEIQALPCYSGETFVTETNIKENCIFDMELHSVALVADVNKIPLISLKKVSDNLSMDNYYENLNIKEIMELESAVELLRKYMK